ncbi:preprotein translocase subunit TatC [Patescibacteria group bacterium]|nr:MAG: preprotein translocase subunit TatC [Patescibacteria group bacterium]
MATTTAIHHGHQPFLDHMYELRSRVLWSVAVVFAGAAIGYLFRNQLISALAQPLNMPLYYTSPSGGFLFVMQVCMLAGGLIALPVFLYNGIRFFEPAFAKSRLSRQKIGVIIAASAVLATAGVLFAYVVVLPASIHFFSMFNVGPVNAWISAKEYLTFATSYLMLMAFLFQLPLILLVANSIRRFPPGSIGKWRKWVVIGSFVVAVPLTYDIMSQVLMAVPIILLYEISGLMVWSFNRRHHQRQAMMSHGITGLEDVQWVEPDLLAAYLQSQSNQQEPAPVVAAATDPAPINDQPFMEAPHVEPTTPTKTTLDQSGPLQLG